MNLKKTLLVGGLLLAAACFSCSSAQAAGFHIGIGFGVPIHAHYRYYHPGYYPHPVHPHYYPRHTHPRYYPHPIHLIPVPVHLAPAPGYYYPPVGVVPRSY